MNGEDSDFRKDLNIGAVKTLVVSGYKGGKDE